MKNLSGRSHNILNIKGIIDDARCFCAVRELRWWPERQRYHCGNCNGYFDDLTGTIFQGHHRALSVWILCLYFMGLNLSNSQIARELDLNRSDVQEMTRQLRQGVVARKPRVKLHGEVEWNEPLEPLTLRPDLARLMRFSANCRKVLKFAGALSRRIRQSSSRKVTSSTQCSRFSTPQWPRIALENSTTWLISVVM
uniref:Transposase n=1 Tax=Candidatus Kentrum eta TaxID=2126337 RepID=A0A450VKE1_9GAMM|nr:MAG: hypothetical protein BECKH772A_GA0070896_105242 [Candidatus Kentron sp. H]